MFDWSWKVLSIGDVGLHQLQPHTCGTDSKRIIQFQS
jgi:hypothetical protein